MNKVHLTYISPFPRSVFESQVLCLVNYLCKTGAVGSADLVLGVDSRIYSEGVRKAGALAVGTNITVHVFKYSPQYPLIYRRSIGSLAQVLRQIRRRGLGVNAVFHVRGESMGLIVQEALKVNGLALDRLVVDVRGAPIEEVALYSNANVLAKRAKILLKNKALKSLKNVGCITAVSEALKDYLDAILKKKKDISVVHSLAGEEFIFSSDTRRLRRAELGLKETDTLFVFSSGSSKNWQRIDHIARTISGAGYKILNLSPERIEFVNVINKYVSFNQVPGYLSASDIAIILRNPDVVNNVASPVKFSEYLCSGLPVIADESVELIQKVLRNGQCGVIIRDIDEIDRNLTQRLLSLNRNEVAAFGQEMFGLKKTALQYQHIYDEMVGQPH